MMKKYRMFACASTLFVLAAAGCAGVSDDAEETELATSGAEAPAPAAPAAEQAPNAAAQSGQTPAARPRLVAPIRGEAPLGYTQPTVKAAKIGGRDFIVTSMQVKNLGTGAIAGLKVDALWYNKAGDLVTGANYRHPRPLQPGEVITVTLQTPRNPAMDRNQYKFEHANGTVKVSLLPKV